MKKANLGNVVKATERKAVIEEILRTFAVNEPYDTRQVRINDIRVGGKWSEALKHPVHECTAAYEFFTAREGRIVDSIAAQLADYVKELNAFMSTQGLED